MGIIRLAIENPVKVAVGVLLTLLFGMIALFTIPIQMTPNVDQPVITIQTNWVGRSPDEVEKEILEPQEEKLKNIANLRKMIATANTGVGEIQLEFYVGTNMDRARQDVSDKLREVEQYPPDVDEPVIADADTTPDRAIAWLILSSSDPTLDVSEFRDQVDDRVRPVLERVPGVASIAIYGGREREVHIRINPDLAAHRGITFNDIRRALQDENVNVSAGDLAEGRLDYRVRTVGQYDNLEDILNTVIRNTSQGPIRIRDIGDVVQSFEKERAFVRAKGSRSMAMPVFRETGANVMRVMADVRQRVDQLNAEGGVLQQIDPTLRIEQVYDETDYIRDAIRLVVNNLWLGGTLAGLTLLVFLRTIRPTLVVAMTIPISIIGTFLVMTAFGRTLNVISLAGMAFAVGMVVDAAIVVLENIDRHLGMGASPRQAALKGASEVWGAIFASVLTTLVVFIPVIFMEEEAGQLFRDISLAICTAVTLSLIVSITVIPSASARFLRTHHEPRLRILRAARGLFGLTRVLGGFATGFANFLYAFMQRGILPYMARVMIVALFTLTAIGGAILLMPPTSYLPTGNKNLVFGILVSPPSYNLEQFSRMGERMENNLRPFWEATSYEELEGLPEVTHPLTGMAPEGTIPPLRHFFFVSFRGSAFYGAASTDDRMVKPLETLLPWAARENPGTVAFAFQQGLFGRDLGGGTAVDVEVRGYDLDEVRQTAFAVQGHLIGRYGPQSVREDPQNYNRPGPEWQARVDYVRASDLGISATDLGLAMRALIDGAVVGDYRLDGENVDLLLTRHPDYSLLPEAIPHIPVAYHDPDGGMGIVPMSAFVQLERAEAPQQIRRIEAMRAVTLTVNAPPGMPLEVLSNELSDLMRQLRHDGVIPPPIETELAGTADKLAQMREALLGEWTGWSIDSMRSLMTSRIFLALLVVYLLMAALFESFLYPFVIMFTVPLATVGGFLGLRIVHDVTAMYPHVPDQQLDVLTMLGFVILIGVVVNNAILIVHQALNFMRGLGETSAGQTQRLSPHEAIRESVRTRVRPVFMTTTTSCLGMLPLVLMPGSGSELYRGLGSVVVGGLIVASLFTLIIVPLLFSLVLDTKRWFLERMGWPLPDIYQQAEESDE